MHVNELEECMVYRAHLKAYSEYLLANRTDFMKSETLVI